MVGNQKVIPGTKELRCSLAEFLEITRYIPFLLSIRSGLLDFAAPGGVNMFVLYADGGAITPENHSLSGWRCEGLLRETTFSRFAADTECRMTRDFLCEIGKNRPYRAASGTRRGKGSDEKEDGAECS